MKTLIIALSLALTGSAFGCSEKTENKLEEAASATGEAAESVVNEAGEGLERAGEELGEAGEATAEEFAEAKRDLVVEMRQTATAMRTNYQHLKERYDDAEDEAMRELSEELGEFDRTMKSVEDSAEQGWDDTKDAAEEAREELEQAYQDAKRELDDGAQ